MDDKLLIHLEIANKSYGLTINRDEEELARKAAAQIRNKMLQYRQVFSQPEVSDNDLLAMVALQLSLCNLQLEERNDTLPICNEVLKLSQEIESYLKNE